MEQKTARQIAEERFELIAPLLEPDIEPAEKKARRERILERQQVLGTPVSERTLRRYVQHYRERGLEGLEPKTRRDQGELWGISRDVLDDAKVLKAELPQRSIRQIIEILEAEGKVEPGSVSHTTPARLNNSSFKVLNGSLDPSNLVVPEEFNQEVISFLAE